MIHHQHYFPVVDEADSLKPVFLAVTNTQPRNEKPIVANAERVLAARLRDASFFWEADRRTALESRLDRLDTVLFHKALGSYRRKAERMAALAEWIAREVFQRPDQAEFARHAALVAKADLTSDMVGEFPELQGVMGGIYAREEGQPEEIWKAIYHHYLPVGIEADAPPSREDLGAAAITWAAVSLADKLDTVVGLFGAGERPTGSRDPFGLRRSAQGVIRILMDLPELTGISRELTLRHLTGSPLLPRDEEVEAVYSAFLYERLLSVLTQRGLPIEVVRAVAAPSDGRLIVNLAVSPLRARRVAEALQAMRASEDFQALAILFKRVKNIAREIGADELARLRDTAGPVRASLSEPAELALVDEMDKRRPVIERAAGAFEFGRAFFEVAALRPAVDRFFTDVFVMVEDAALRQARLRLMADLRDMVLDLADISEIIPQTES
jgi:glycyl-tRNA synthetase beta chain